MSFFLMVSKDLSDCHWIQLRGQERLNATPEESKRCKRAQPFRGEKPRALEFNYRPFSDMTSIFLAHHESSWNSPPDIEYLNIVRKRVLLEKVQKYLWVGNFTMDHITNYSAHLESPSVKQLCEQTHVHRWEPISDKMFTNKRIDLLANLGRLTPKLFANGKHR